MSAEDSPRPLTIEVVSDVVCPWCYVGKRRLEKAIAAAAQPVSVSWGPFQLDAGIPPEGKDRRAYLEAKFGSAERIREIHDRLTALGAAEGIRFAFDRIAISPNTLDAHRLIRWAGEAGVADAVVEALFRSFFIEGRDIGDRDVLADIAAGAGLDREDIHARLLSAAGRKIVQRDIEKAQWMGITGVPTFILAGQYALVGAQPPETIARIIRDFAAQASAASHAV